MREVYVNISSVEKAKGLNGVLRKLEGISIWFRESHD